MALQATCKPGTVEAAAQHVKAEQETAARQKADIAAALHGSEATHHAEPLIARWQQYD